MASAGSERPVTEGSRLGEAYEATCRGMEGTEEKGFLVIANTLNVT